MHKRKIGGNKISYTVDEYVTKEGSESRIYIPPKVPFSVIDKEYDISKILPFDASYSEKYRKLLSVFFKKSVKIDDSNKHTYLGKIIKEKSNLFNMINNYTIIEKICKKNAELDVERLLYISVLDTNECQLIVNNLGTTTMQDVPSITGIMLAVFIKSIATLNSNDFVHFDIKQDNIMLFNDRLMLIDYGMSCVKEALEERMIMMLSSKNGIATLYPFEVVYVNARATGATESKIKMLMKMFAFNGFCGVANKLYKIAYRPEDEYQKDETLCFKDAYCVFGTKAHEYMIKRQSNGDMIFLEKDRMIDNIYECLSKSLPDTEHYKKIDTFYIGLVLVGLKNEKRISIKNIKPVIRKCISMDVANRMTTEELYETFSVICMDGGRAKAIPHHPEMLTKPKNTKQLQYHECFDIDFTKNMYIYAENAYDSTKNSIASNIIDNLAKR